MTRPELFEGYVWLVTELYKQENYARRVLTGVERMGPAPTQSGQKRLPSVPQVQDLLRALRAFSLSADPVRRRHFLPNLLKVAARNPSRLVEAASHLGMWRHFEIYVPQLVAQIREAEGRERVRARERAFAEARSAAPTGLEAALGMPAALLLNAAPV